MGLINWMRDRKRLSMEKHEIDYCKKLAKLWLKRLDGEPEHVKRLIRVSSLRRMCKYILKTRPDTRNSDR